MTAYQSQIKLPKAHFKKARNEYFNWKFAWAREILQNSYDAVMKTGGGRIDFDFDEKAKTITVTDTGIGMSEETLLNVLLCWGGSDKQMGDGSVGGFGYAKNILYFGSERFQIWSLDNYVVGEGGQFNHSKVGADSILAGTRSMVEFESLWDIEGIRDSLLGMLALFDPECKLDVFVDGKQQPLGQNSSYMRDYIEGPFGDFWYYEEKQAVHTAVCSATVRIKGLPMFSLQQEVQAAKPLHGVLDISSKYDLMQLLTANRDSFRGSHGSELYRFVSRLANDRSAAKMGEPFEVVLNTFNLLDAEIYGSDPVEGSAPAEVLADTTEEGEQVRAMLQGVKHNLPNFPANFSIGSSFRLNTKEGRGVIKYLGTRKAAVMAHTWREVVKHVLASGAIEGITYHTENGQVEWEENDGYGEFRYNGKPVHTGYIFDENVEGQLANVAGNLSVCMNPDKLWSDWLIGDLIDLAAHEVTHLLHSSHNESFIIMLDEIRKHLRRYTDEPSLLRWIDQHLRSIGLRGRT